MKRDVLNWLPGSDVYEPLKNTSPKRLDKSKKPKPPKQLEEKPPNLHKEKPEKGPKEPIGMEKP